MTTTAIIVGNGKSRKTLDIDFFRPLGQVYACNGAHRDLKVDWLVAIDDKIIGEILESSFPQHRFIVPPLNEQYEPSEYSPMRRRENAGMIAMREAIKRQNTKLYCIGFDFMFEDAELNAANIYDNTNGYGIETRASVDDCKNRVAYMDWFAGKNSSVEFIFTYPESEKGRIFRPVRSTNIKVTYVSGSTSSSVQ